MNNAIVTVYLQANREVKTRPLFRYDYGITLKLTGVDLPQAYEVHFANSISGNSVTQIGNADGVAIPDACLTNGNDIHVWLYLHEGQTDGETVRRCVIPVIERAKPTNETPTPVQQDAITEAIAALNVAVTQTAEDVAQTGRDVIAADESASAAAYSEANAKASEDKAKEYADDALAAASGMVNFYIDNDGHIIVETKEVLE